jgi:3-keto-L-gulonate-6-phosphate decarboxylase
MSAKLQPALDLVELEDALALLKKVHPFADILEVGPPTLIRYGVEAVRRVKGHRPETRFQFFLKVARWPGAPSEKRKGSSAKKNRTAFGN